MMGCKIGFKKKLINVAVGGKLYIVRVLAHQLDLIIKARLHVSSEAGYFSLFEVEMTIIRWMRRQDKLIQSMGSKCPYYINVK